MKTDYNKIRDEDVRTLIKKEFGICGRCINKLTKQECILILNKRIKPD